MYNHSKKKQVLYSLTQLSGALFFFLREKKIEDITVTELCNKAEISRRTFYRNCDNMADLILFSADCLVTDLLGQVDFLLTDPQIMYHGFFSFWEKHKEFLDIIYRNSLFDLFLTEFVSICNLSMRYPLQEASIQSFDNQEMVRKYSNTFIVGGLGQMLRQWAEDGFCYSAHELADSIVYLSPVQNHPKPE